MKHFVSSELFFYLNKNKMKTYKITVYFNDALLFTTDGNNINNKKTLNQVMDILKRNFSF